MVEWVGCRSRCVPVTWCSGPGAEVGVSQICGGLGAEVGASHICGGPGAEVDVSQSHGGMWVTRSELHMTRTQSVCLRAENSAI